MKNLYMVRHGQSEHNVDYDLLLKKEETLMELTGKGVTDAMKAAATLKTLLDLHGDKDPIFIVSTYTRAKQTFYTISDTLNLKVSPIFDANTVEHKLNLIGNEKNQEMFKAYRANRFYIRENDKDFMDKGYEGGESPMDVYRRAADWLKYVKAFPERAVVLVSHGQFIKMILAHTDGLDARTAWNKEMANGEVNFRVVG